MQTNAKNILSMAQVISFLMSIFFTGVYSGVSGQAPQGFQEDTIRKKANNIGITPYPLINNKTDLLKINSFGLSYERRIAYKLSVVLHTSIGYESKTYPFVTTSTAIGSNYGAVDTKLYKVNTTTFGIRPEFRYYFREDSSEAKRYNNGFYAGGNLGMEYSNSQFKPSPNPQVENLSSNYKTFMVGPVVGYQKVLKFGLMLNVGGSLSYTITGGKFNNDPNKITYRSLDLKDSFFGYIRVGYAF